MVKHIVMWKLKDNVMGKTKKENSLIIKEKLESLNGEIDGLIKLEVGIDFSKTENSYDLVLYSEFVSKRDLENYQAHPRHKEVASYIAEVREERIVVDYEV